MSGVRILASLPVKALQEMRLSIPGMLDVSPSLDRE